MTCIVGVKTDKIYIGADTFISSIYNCDSKIVKKERTLIGCVANRCGYNFAQMQSFPDDWDMDDAQVNQFWARLRKDLPYPQYEVGYVLTGGNCLIQMWNGMGWSRLHESKQVLVAAPGHDLSKVLTVLGEQKLADGMQGYHVVEKLLYFAEDVHPTVRKPFEILVSSHG